MSLPSLPIFRLDEGVSIAQATPWHLTPVTLESPATAVMTDLTLVKAATIAPETPLRQAEQMMIFQGVRMLFVVSGMPAFIGLVTSTDLHGDRQMSLVHTRGVRYDDLTVAEVMTPRAQINAVDFARVARTQVGQLIATLRRSGRDHLLVVQEADAGTPRRVRGVVSRSQIERQLGQAIALTPIAEGFSEIERALL